MQNDHKRGVVCYFLYILHSTLQQLLLKKESVDNLVISRGAKFQLNLMAMSVEKKEKMISSSPSLPTLPSFFMITLLLIICHF